MQIAGRSHPFFWFVLVYTAIVAAIFVATGVVVFRFGWPERDWGWKFEFRNEHYYITQVDPQGPAAGKPKPDDRIIAVNGDPSFQTVGIQGQWIIRILSDSYSIRISRGSIEKEFQLKVQLRKNWHFFLTLLTMMVAALISVITAIFVGLSRPEDRTVQLFSVTWLSVGLVQLIPVMKLIERVDQTHIRCTTTFLVPVEEQKYVRAR